MLKVLAGNHDSRGGLILTDRGAETSRGPQLFLVHEDSLLPVARGFVGPVDAARPAARASLAFQQFFTGALDAALPGLGLFRIFDPADEFIPAERRQSLPERIARRV